MNNAFRTYLKSLGFKIKVENIDPKDPSFAELRTETFGGSDSSKILGVNPFPRGDRQSLLIDKLNKFHDPTIGAKPSVRMGADLEDFVLERLSNATGFELFKPDDMWWEEETGMAMNFDGMIVTGYEPVPYLPAEVKIVTESGSLYYDFRKAVNVDKNPSNLNTKIYPPETSLEFIQQNGFSLEGDNLLEKYIYHKASQYGIPPYYYTQLLDEMYFSGAPYGFLIAMSIKNWTLYGFKVKRDQYIIDNLRKETKSIYEDYKILKEQPVSNKTKINPL